MRILTFVSFCVASVGAVNGDTEAEKEEARRNEAGQVELWEAKLTECKDKADQIKLKELSLGLRNMGYRTTRPTHGADVTSLYARLQREILSIPGHAEFYAAPIWESYRAYRDTFHPKHPGSATWFSSEAQYGLKTLQHLPSPETVNALGEMLREEWQKQPRADSTVQNVPGALGKNAMRALLELPLRDMPTAHYKREIAKEQLSAWQQWYAEVKSGQRTFSFKGQPVEYRFKPDGTWDTIAIADPPDDGAIIQDTKATEPRPKTNPAPDPKPEDAENETMLYLLAVIAAFLAAAAVYFARRHFRTKH